MKTDVAEGDDLHADVAAFCRRLHRAKIYLLPSTTPCVKQRVIHLRGFTVGLCYNLFEKNNNNKMDK